MCVHETKLENISESRYYTLWSKNDVSWVHIGVDKEGGEILIMWDNQQFKGEGFLFDSWGTL